MNADLASVDERIRLIIDTQDPAFVNDLRHLNSGRPHKYDLFWDQCNKYLEKVIETPVDERRHSEIPHLAKALSTRYLLNEVAKQCPEGVPVPSKQWLRLQFWPKNPCLKSALQYTGKLKVKFIWFRLGSLGMIMLMLIIVLLIFDTCER